MVAVTIAVFLPSLRGAFLNWDDDANFLHNFHYRGLGPEQLKWMFTDYFGHYMPFTWLTLGLDYVVWGMNPLGYHLTSLLFHAANAALFFYLLRSLLRRARPGDDDQALGWIAAAGALFFSIHPLRVESVAWITERRDVTSGLFFLLTALAYVRMTSEQPSTAPYRKWLGLSLAAFAGSLLCKAMGMTLPLVLLLLDVWPLKRFGPGKTAAVLREKIPFLLLMAAGLSLTSIAQRHAGALYTEEDYPISQSLAQPGYRVSFYVLKTLLPVGLSPLYFYRPELGVPQGLGWVAVVGTTLLVLFRRREAPAAAAAWLSYGLLIAPVCGLVQAGPHFAADRYTYLACLPWAAFATALLALPRSRLAVALLAGTLLTVLSVLTGRQTLIWRDSVSLWDAAIRVDPDVYYTWHNRGRAKAERGDLEGAIVDFSRAIELRSGYPDPWRERGRLRARQNRHDLAVTDLETALRLAPQRADTAFDLGVSEARLGRSRESLLHFAQALALRPEYIEVRVQRARLLAMEGDLTSARADLDVALRLRPTPFLYLERATIRALASDLDGTIEDCSEALRLEPDYAEAYARRGMARLEQRQNGQAAIDLQKALDRTPAQAPQRGSLLEALRRAQAP